LIEAALEDEKVKKKRKIKTKVDKDDLKPK
jgi:hypothetical protein